MPLVIVISTAAPLCLIPGATKVSSKCMFNLFLFVLLTFNKHYRVLQALRNNTIITIIVNKTIHSLTYIQSLLFSALWHKPNKCYHKSNVVNIHGIVWVGLWCCNLLSKPYILKYRLIILSYLWKPPFQILVRRIQVGPWKIHTGFHWRKWCFLQSLLKSQFARVIVKF